MTSKTYFVAETAIEFTASGGDVVFSPAYKGTLAGRQSAQHDFGAAARTPLYNWRAYLKFGTTPVLGQTVEIYIKTSDGTHADNDDGTSDGDITAANKLKNLKHIGSVIVDEASSTPEFSASGTVILLDRYVQVVFWNTTDDALSGTGSDHGFILEPVAYQGQDT